jgi:hypothetical protein
LIKKGAYSYLTPTKIQQYYIFKFSTDRLKRSNYNIKINPHQARKNGELISLGESQMLKSLREIKGRHYTKDEIDNLFEQKRKIKVAESTPEKILELRTLENKIDEILFVPEILSIVVEDTRHYEELIENGLFVNDKKFVRLMCSAGQMRRNNVIFIDSEYEKQLKKVLNNDRSDIELNPSKFNAYFALSSSTALPVTKPYFCVVPDAEISRIETVEYIEEKENGDDEISVQDKEIIFNLFDGQGVISPRHAKKWVKDLGLDYLPSAFIVRGNFIKGLVVVIDFVKFSDMIGKRFITDIYGNKVNIRDMDVILTESQFKLSKSFDSIQQYQKNCEKNNLGWWVSRYSPKQDPKYTFTNYQFLQALDLNDPEKIKKLSQKTVDYFNNTIKNEIGYTLLYLLGKHSNTEEVDEYGFLDKIDDTITKALILRNDLIEDTYIQKHIINRLNRKIKESYIGKLLIDGFYTFAISDPYAFLEYLFDMPIKGLLNRGEHYNKFYVEKGVEKAVSMRAPLTWRSEVNSLKIVSNEKINDWYQYINTGTIINVHGTDCMLMADSDFDGDIICVTDEEQIVNNNFGGLPIYYETEKTPKQEIIEEELFKYDIKGFNPKIGFLTNCSTTMYAMLPEHEKEGEEYNEIVRRLKQCRKEQGSIIDSAKGLVVRPIPQHWTRWVHIDEEKMSEDEIEWANLSNSIVVDKRPIFMTHLYYNYAKERREFENNYNIYCVANFGITLDEMLEKNAEELVEDEKKFLNLYKKYNPFLSTDCVTNNVSFYMQSKIKEIKFSRKKANVEKILHILRDPDIEIEKNKLKKLYNLYKKYKSEKRNLYNIRNASGEQMYKTLEQYNKAVRKEAYAGISSNIRELANLAITICYEINPSDNKSFAWNVFGEGIVENIKKNRQKEIYVPVLNEHTGKMEYLGRRYSMTKIEVEDSQRDGFKSGNFSYGGCDKDDDENIKISDEVCMEANVCKYNNLL